MEKKENSLMKMFKPEDVIIREGELCHEMYKILSGNAALYMHYGKENEYLMGVLGEQKCIGEVSLLANRPIPYTVVALSNMMVMQINADQFESFIVKNTKNAVDIMTNMAKSIVMLSTDINLLADDFSNMVAQLKEQIDNSDEKMISADNLNEKLAQYKMTALTGGNIYSANEE